MLGLGGNLVFTLKPPRHLVLPYKMFYALDEVTAMPAYAIAGIARNGGGCCSTEGSALIDRFKSTPKQELAVIGKPRATEIRARPPVLLMCRGGQMTICLHGRLVMSRLVFSIIGIVKRVLWGKAVCRPRGGVGERCSLA